MLAIPKLSFDRVRVNNLALALLVVVIVSGMLFYFIRTERLGWGSLAALFLVAQDEPTEEVIEEEIVNHQTIEFIEEAQSGDGLTHLARRAVDRYINETGEEIGSERRVYAEDHIQRALGGGPLSLGEEVSISRDLVVDAINLSLELDSHQIENLEHYSSLVAAFN